MKHLLPVVLKHKILSLIVIALLIIGIAVPLFISKPTTGSVYTVTRENLTNTILVDGTYEIASQTQVLSPTNGVITQLFVTNGTEVKKGDNLFHVTSSATADQQKTAYAAYLADQTALQADTATLYTLQSAMYGAWKKFTDLATNSTYQNGDKSPNTTNRVLPEFTTTQDNWLAAEADYKNQQGVLAKDQAALASGLQAYNETQSVTVTAPIAGQVINLASKSQDQVSAPSETQPAAPPVLMIANFSNPVLVSAVDQVNIPELKIGQKASIVFDALPDQTFSGKISNIDSAGTKTQGTVNFNVYVALDHVPTQIRPNMTASLTIETARRDNTLTIPNDAVIQRDGKTFVRRSGNNSNSLTKVALGLKGITKTEVVSGLSAGDKIIEQQ